MISTPKVLARCLVITAEVVAPARSGMTKTFRKMRVASSTNLNRRLRRACGMAKMEVSATCSRARPIASVSVPPQVKPSRAPPTGYIEDGDGPEPE